MKWLMLSTSFAALVLATAPGAAQDYWEYDTWEGQWEHHYPTAGEKIEYGDGVSTEQEAYEWEPGEGYHQEEWYDPSDWFDDDTTVDYEYDYDYGDYGYGYGYYDDYYDDYDTYDYDYDYAETGYDYEFDQQAKGQVVGLERIRGGRGAPQSVRLRLRTDDGQTRTLHLGDIGYVDRYLPRIEKGDRIIVGGRYVDVNGRRMFKAEEMRTAAGSYQIPDYEYDRRIEGRLVGLRRVRTRGGDVQAVVAKVEPWEGKTLNVLLGRPEDLRGQGQTIRPGARVRVEGYRREVDGRSTFVVQDVRVLQQQGERQQQARRQQDQRQARRDQQGDRERQQARQQQDQRQARREPADRQRQSQARDQQQRGEETRRMQNGR